MASAAMASAAKTPASVASEEAMESERAVSEALAAASGGKAASGGPMTQARRGIASFPIPSDPPDARRRPRRAPPGKNPRCVRREDPGGGGRDARGVHGRDWKVGSRRRRPAGRRDPLGRRLARRPNTRVPGGARAPGGHPALLQFAVRRIGEEGARGGASARARGGSGASRLERLAARLLRRLLAPAPVPVVLRGDVDSSPWCDRRRSTGAGGGAKQGGGEGQGASGGGGCETRGACQRRGRRGAQGGALGGEADAGQNDARRPTLPSPARRRRPPRRRRAPAPLGIRLPEPREA